MSELAAQAFSHAAGAPLISGNTIGAAFTDRRVLEPVESRIMLTVGALLLALAILFWFFPRLLVYPLIAVFVWVAVGFLYKGYWLHRRKDKREAGALKEQDRPSQVAAEASQNIKSKRN